MQYDLYYFDNMLSGFFIPKNKSNTPLLWDSLHMDPDFNI